MTRSVLPLFAAALACAALPAGAGAGWSPPQDLGPAGYSYDDNALASNARGDAVTAFSQAPGIHVARAAPGAPFGAGVLVSRNGVNPRVAIDPRGVALITWEYDDGSFEEFEDRGSTTCCRGTKVVVWRPGQAPTRPRVVRRVGITATEAELAAVRGRRGVVVNTYSREGEARSVRFVPIGLDGRPGKARIVVRRGWHAVSLQFVGTRAVVGLVDGDGPTRVAVRTQRPTGSFGPIRIFLRVPDQLTPTSPAFAEILMTADGRGGQVAVLQRGRGARRHVEVVRQRRGRKLRRVTVKRGPANDFVFSRPSVASDGWIAVAFKRIPAIFTSLDGIGYVVAIRPDGRERVTQLTGIGNVGSPAATVRAGGSGAAGFVESLPGPGPYRARSSWLALAAGLPRPDEALARSTTGAVIEEVAMTSNGVDRARIVFREGRRVLASRLE